jgi:glycerophosphoryl diester phosphodiesterase
VDGVRPDRSQIVTALVLGHRGHPEHENTLRGVSRALAAGLDGVEVDLRRCADQSIVLFHDPTLSRVVGDDRDLSEIDLPTLRDLRTRGGEPVATLDELLAIAPPGVTLNLEIKAHPAPALDRVLEAIRDRQDVILSSFDQGIVEVLAGVSPPHPIAWIVDGDARATAPPEAVEALGVSALHLRLGPTPPDAIGRWVARGITVGVWGAATLALELEAVAAGATRVITDFVEAHALRREAHR